MAHILGITLAKHQPRARTSNVNMIDNTKAIEECDSMFYFSKSLVMAHFLVQHRSKQNNQRVNILNVLSSDSSIKKCRGNLLKPTTASFILTSINMNIDKNTHLNCEGIAVGVLFNSDGLYKKAKW